MTTYRATDNFVYDFVNTHYDVLVEEFFFHVYPASRRGPKPQYLRPSTGSYLYEGKVDSTGLKLYSPLLSAQEKEALGWKDTDPAYRYPFRSRCPGLAPTWYRFIEQHENVVDQVFFNIAHPGSTISAHYGVVDLCYRIHLCLQENPGFTFDVDGHIQQWKVGPEHMFRFDDGRVNHGVCFDPTLDNGKPRIVAIFDVKREVFES